MTVKHAMCYTSTLIKPIQIDDLFDSNAVIRQHKRDFCVLINVFEPNQAEMKEVA